MKLLEAYEYLSDHPNTIIVDPTHPLVDTDEYAYEGFGKSHFGRRKGKPRDEEYERAFKERAIQHFWSSQFLDNLDFGYYEEDGNPMIWLESGPAYWDEYINEYRGNMHDIDLDVYAPTFEEALILLAEKVKEKYG